METWGTEDFAFQRIIWPREFNAVIFSSEELDSLPPSLSLAGNDSSLNLTALLLEWEAECDCTSSSQARMSQQIESMSIVATAFTVKFTHAFKNARLSDHARVLVLNFLFRDDPSKGFSFGAQQQIAIVIVLYGIQIIFQKQKEKSNRLQQTTQEERYSTMGSLRKREVSDTSLKVGAFAAFGSKCAVWSTSARRT